MISLGVDAGIEYTKVALLKPDGSFIPVIIKNNLSDENEIVESAVKQALSTASLSQEEIHACGKAGTCARDLTLEGQIYPEVMALKAGIEFLSPDTLWAMDTGARKFIAVLCRDDSFKYASGERCASGAGAYLNMVSAFLHLSLEEMNQMYFQSESGVLLETKCAVFAESEIISRVHHKTPVEDIVRGAFLGLAKRSMTPLVQVGASGSVTITGGVTHLPAYLDAMKSVSGMEIKTLENGEFSIAVGAALLAAAARRKQTC